MSTSTAPSELSRESTREAHEAIQLEHVSRTYGEGHASVDALRDVSLTIERGEFVVLLGPSGSGKTTLLNIVGGIESPTSGRVIVDGQDISALDRDGLTTYRREHVGFVFQFFNLIPTLTAFENVELIAELSGAAAKSHSREYLDRVGLALRVDHFPGSLSGGEQQRVAIARALAKDPRLLLCDEPTGALDLDTGRQVLSLLHSVSRDDTRTVLLVTHNSAIAAMADRVVRMRSGELVDDTRVASPVPPQEVSW